MEKNLQFKTDETADNGDTTVENSNLIHTVKIEENNTDTEKKISNDNNDRTTKSPRPKPNDMHVIKPTSISPKTSKNIFEESARVVGDISIAVDGFGMITTDKSTEVVKRFTFTNKNKMQVQIITLGATVTSIKLPDKNGLVEDIVLGFDSIEGVN